MYVALCQLLHADDVFDPIRSYIREQLVERQVPSLSVAVAKGDRIIWEQAFGWADRERRIPADSNTPYSIASISKPMTATALMTLVAAHKIDLDKPVDDYLGSAKLRARIGSAGTRRFVEWRIIRRACPSITSSSTKTNRGVLLRWTKPFSDSEIF